jgi:predicted nucleic acid-binding protein
VKAYVDSSVLIRLIFGEPHPLVSWTQVETAVSSELVQVECLRTIDRASFDSRLPDDDLAFRRSSAFELLERISIVPIGSEVLDRAAGPFPTSIGTLDAIHLSSALLVRDHFEDLVFATHDRALGIAARAMGFQVEGI